MSNAWMQAASPKGRFLKWENDQDEHTILINGSVEEREQVYQGKTVRYQSGPREGQAKKEYLIPGLDYAAESKEDAQVIMPIKEGHQMAAVARALKAVGETFPREGVVLAVKRDGYGQAHNGGNPPRAWSASATAAEPQGEEWGSEDE